MSSLVSVTLPQPTCRVPLLKVLRSWSSSFAHTEKRHPATFLTGLLEKFGTHRFNLNVVAELSPGGRLCLNRGNHTRSDRGNGEKGPLSP